MRIASVEEVQIGQHDGVVNVRSRAQVGKTIKTLRWSVSERSKWNGPEGSLSRHACQARSEKARNEAFARDASNELVNIIEDPSWRMKCGGPCVEQRIRRLEGLKHESVVQLKYVDFEELRAVTNNRCVTEQIKNDEVENIATGGVIIERVNTPSTS